MFSVFSYVVLQIFSGFYFRKYFYFWVLLVVLALVLKEYIVLSTGLQIETNILY
jgi:hypothetical protein